MERLDAFAPRIAQQRKTLKDLVVEALREAILTGVLEDGIEISQASLAEQFGTSRIPVREAINQLASDGLVEMKPYHRAIVTSLSRPELEELFEIRIALERVAVRNAVRRMTESDLEQLWALHREMEAVQEHDRWLELNAELHMRLCALADMKTLGDLLANLRDRTQRYFRRAPRVYRSREANREHWHLLEACARRDVADAERILEVHIRTTLASLVEHLYGGQAEQSAT